MCLYDLYTMLLCVCVVPFVCCLFNDSVSSSDYGVGGML
jgi:hypothetical protein